MAAFQLFSLAEWRQPQYAFAMKTALLIPFGLALVAAFGLGTTRSRAATPTTDITVAAYYFPNYHPTDPRNTKEHGKGWSEWEIVKAARPRFAGHEQPKVPLWGYTDESDPRVMEQKIAAAADHGIGVFIYDWYYYNDGLFLERGLEKGFFGATNRNRLKFCLMWADHDYTEIFPFKPKLGKAPLLYPGKVTPETFDRMTDYIIATYFKHPSHWLIEGRPYFSIYDVGMLIGSFGSVTNTRVALDRFRAKTRAAGFPGLHLNAVVWGAPVLPGESAPADWKKLVPELGFDSLTSYVWAHHGALREFPLSQYVEGRDRYFQHWEKMLRDFSLPYFPNVSMGWDSSPRTDQSEPFTQNHPYPFTPILVGNTPEQFRAALQITKDRLLAAPTTPKIVTINSWNEWTEGSYLEPDTVHGMKYLEAIRAVFGAGAKKPEKAGQ